MRKIGQPEAVPLFVDVERDANRLGTSCRKVLFRFGTGDELVDQVSLPRGRPAAEQSFDRSHVGGDNDQDVGEDIGEVDL
ncbi:hypothetical protein [Rhodococcus rhodochrous]|uniref:Uncharacterized protein n=1 Tax=Rhodococcus rhodochrous TaxID=1829 RepID=A0AA46X1T0_RHORH|nr:hypothetical protein [Rhodococcus rhodochrous]UZF48508.1 hypothetical protein KUM34_029500 [Rhodococcus rhodochrous]